MQAIANSEYGPPEDLKLEEIDPPAVDEDGVLVRVRAASVNPFDWHTMRGLPYLVRLMMGLRRPKRPVRGVDMAGTVEAVGANVTQVRPGDEVYGWGRHGALAEYERAGEKLVRAEAGRPLVRAGGGDSDGGLHRAPGAARQGRAAAGTAGPDQRRRRRRGHVRRADREGARRERDRRVQHAERRPRPLDRRRPGHRLHGGGLHAEGSSATT